MASALSRRSGTRHPLGSLLFKVQTRAGTSFIFHVSVTSPKSYSYCGSAALLPRSQTLYAGFRLPFLVLFHRRGTLGFWCVDTLAYLQEDVASWQKPFCRWLLSQELIMRNLLIFVKGQDWEL